MLTLIRHTKPQVETGLCYGQSDLSLALSYPKELEQIRANLSTKPHSQIYSSPLKRCTILTQDLFSNFKCDARLMEMNFGDWELKKWDDINDNYAQKWYQDYINTPCPNGESFIEMQHRVLEFYNEKIKSQKKDTIIVCHGGVIRLFLNIIQNIPLSKVFDIKIDYGAILYL